MKKSTIIILLFFSISLNAQTLIELQEKDTLYFYFAENDFQKKKVYKDTKENDSIIAYKYFKDNKEIISFKYLKFEDFDSRIAGEETYVKNHKKRFLKEHISAVVDIKLLHTYNPKQLFNFLSSRRWKVNFIVDKSEFKGKTIVLRKVFIDTSFDVNDTEKIEKLYPRRFLEPFYEESGINDHFFTFIIPNVNGTDTGEDLYILFEESDNAVKEDTYKYTTQKGNSHYGEPMIREQFTLKLNIKEQIVFFQLTHQRKETAKISKIYNFFTKSYNTVSLEDLENFSEEQLEILFSNTRHIYLVEKFDKKKYVIPLLVKPTSDWVDFVKND